MHLADGPVALLGDNDLRLAGVLFALFAAMKVLFAVNEHDDIRVLLDRPRFAQMAEPGNIVFAHLGLPVELLEQVAGGEGGVAERVVWIRPAPGAEFRPGLRKPLLVEEPESVDQIGNRMERGPFVRLRGRRGRGGGSGRERFLSPAGKTWAR